jgi:hypothetical protein
VRGNRTGKGWFRRCSGQRKVHSCGEPAPATVRSAPRYGVVRSASAARDCADRDLDRQRYLDHPLILRRGRHPSPPGFALRPFTDKSLLNAQLADGGPDKWAPKRLPAQWAWRSVAALTTNPAEGSTCCCPLPHHPHSRYRPARRRCRRSLATHQHARARGCQVL